MLSMTSQPPSHPPPPAHCTDKKENKIFLIYREIQMGSGAKSYMRKGFLIYEELHKYFHHIQYEEVVMHL
jgi:hypothetical protein